MADVDAQSKRLRTSLEGWREIIVRVHAVLIWEKPYHVYAIVGACTIFYTLLWLIGASTLTTLASLALLVVLADYAVPNLLAPVIFGSASTPGAAATASWTAEHDSRFADACRQLVVAKEKLVLTYDRYRVMRTTKPRLYYGMTVVGLAALAWIGNAVDNLALAFVSTTVLLLLPGLERHGLVATLRTQLTCLYATLSPCLSSISSSDTAKKVS